MKKPDKIFLYIFFLYIKILTGYQRYQDHSEEEKDKKR